MTTPTFRRPFLPVVAVALLALALAACDSLAPDAAESAATAQAPLAFAQAKLPVCHATGSETNEYALIEVAEAAYDTHVAHGDASPGEAVPGMDGYVFDDACQPVVACPCSRFALAAAIEDPDASGVYRDHIEEFMPGLWTRYAEGTVYVGDDASDRPITYELYISAISGAGLHCTAFTDVSARLVSSERHEYLTAAEANACLGLLDSAFDGACTGNKCGDPFEVLEP